MNYASLSALRPGAGLTYPSSPVRLPRPRVECHVEALRQCRQQELI